MNDQDTAAALTDEQKTRAEALRQARKVLAVSGFGTTSPVEATDVVAVAGWIVDGQDPWPIARSHAAGGIDVHEEIAMEDGDGRSWRVLVKPLAVAAVALALFIALILWR